MPGSSATEALRTVQEFMASESANTQEKVDRLVSFLADDLSPPVVMLSNEKASDIVADALANEQAQQEALLKHLGGMSAALAADTEDQDGALRIVLAKEPAKDLVADALARKNEEEEELLKKLTGDAMMATGDQDELVEQIIDSPVSTNEALQGDALLGIETSVQANGGLNSEENPDLVGQVIDALASTNDGIEVDTLLTSEFNGETSEEVKLEARDSTADMVDQITQYLTNAAESNVDEAMLAKRHSDDLQGQLLATDIATADEKMDQVVAFLASASEREYPDSQAKYTPTLPTKTPTNAPKFQHGKHEFNSNGAPAALALEATTASAVGQLRSPEALTMSLEQDHLPHMMFGGAFLLVAAVLLTVMTKRSRGPRLSVPANDEAYAYFLHE